MRRIHALAIPLLAGIFLFAQAPANAKCHLDWQGTESDGDDAFQQAQTDSGNAALVYENAFQKYLLAEDDLLVCLKTMSQAEATPSIVRFGILADKAAVAAQYDGEYAVAYQQYGYAVQAFKTALLKKLSPSQEAMARAGLRRSQSSMTKIAKAAEHQGAMTVGREMPLSLTPGLISTPTPSPRTSPMTM